jgi:hypothetical protein
MSTTSPQIRDAVVVLLNGQTWNPSLMAVGAYEISLDLQDLTGARLLVIPETKTPKLLTRGGAQRKETSISVAVQYKADAITNAAIDPYMIVAEQIGDFLLGKKLSTGHVCLEQKWPVGIFIPAHMEKFQVLTCVISATFVINE